LLDKKKLSELIKNPSFKMMHATGVKLKGSPTVRISFKV